MSIVQSLLLNLYIHHHIVSSRIIENFSLISIQQQGNNPISPILTNGQCGVSKGCWFVRFGGSTNPCDADTCDLLFTYRLSRNSTTALLLFEMAGIAKSGANAPSINIAISDDQKMVENLIQFRRGVKRLLIIRV